MKPQDESVISRFLLHVSTCMALLFIDLHLNIDSFQPVVLHIQKMSLNSFFSDEDKMVFTSKAVCLVGNTSRKTLAYNYKALHHMCLLNREKNTDCQFLTCLSCQ